VASIQDWASRCALRIKSVEKGASVERLAAVIEVFAKPMLDLLKQARREHYHCDDSWYCCGRCTHPDHSRDDEDFPASHESGSGNRVSGVCNCGADEFNAKIDAALR
jgi:hypothetical protein